MANKSEPLSFGTMLGIKDKNYLMIKNNIKKLEEEFKEKQRKLKDKNNPYLASLITQNNDILYNKIDICKQKCDGLMKLVSHLMSLSSTKILIDKMDEKLVLDEYKNLKKELSELTDLLIE